MQPTRPSTQKNGTRQDRLLESTQQKEARSMQPTRSRTQKNQVVDRTGVRRRPYKARRAGRISAGEVVLLLCPITRAD